MEMGRKGLETNLSLKKDYQQLLGFTVSIAFENVNNQDFWMYNPSNNNKVMDWEIIALINYSCIK